MSKKTIRSLGSDKAATERSFRVWLSVGWVTLQFVETRAMGMVLSDRSASDFCLLEQIPTKLWLIAL